MFSLPLARAVVAGKVEGGIAICGSGVGASICVNKVPARRTDPRPFFRQARCRRRPHEYSIMGRRVGPRSDSPTGEVQSGGAPPPPFCQSKVGRIARPQQLSCCRLTAEIVHGPENHLLTRTACRGQRKITTNAARRLLEPRSGRLSRFCRDRLLGRSAKPLEAHW